MSALTIPRQDFDTRFITDMLPNSLAPFRLQEDAARRQESIEAKTAALHQDWTFQPTLSTASARVVGDSSWAGALIHGGCGGLFLGSNVRARGPRHFVGGEKTNA